MHTLFQLVFLLVLSYSNAALGCSTILNMGHLPILLSLNGSVMPIYTFEWGGEPVHPPHPPHHHLPPPLLHKQLDSLSITTERIYWAFMQAWVVNAGIRETYQGFSSLCINNSHSNCYPCFHWIDKIPSVVTCVVLHCLILSKVDTGPQVCAMQLSERGQEGMGSAKQAFTSSTGGVGIWTYKEFLIL